MILIFLARLLTATSSRPRRSEACRRHRGPALRGCLHALSGSQSTPTGRPSPEYNHQSEEEERERTKGGRSVEGCVEERRASFDTKAGQGLPKRKEAHAENLDRQGYSTSLSLPEGNLCEYNLHARRQALTMWSAGSAEPNHSGSKIGDSMSMSSLALNLFASISSIVKSQYGTVSLGLTSC